MDITKETLELAQDGDHFAQEQLMNGIYQPVYHYLVKRTGRNEEADELCQEVFLKVFERLDSYRSEVASVKTWVFTIARNTLVDFYRRQKSENRGDLSEVVAEDVASNPTALAEGKISIGYVSHLLKKLSEEEADVVTLRAIDEMPYPAIAKIIEKTEVATRQTYSRALAKLRTIVEEEEVEKPYG